MRSHRATATMKQIKDYDLCDAVVALVSFTCSMKSIEVFIIDVTVCKL